MSRWKDNESMFFGEGQQRIAICHTKRDLEVPHHILFQDAKLLSSFSEQPRNIFSFSCYNEVNKARKGSPTSTSSGVRRKSESWCSGVGSNPSVAEKKLDGKKAEKN